MWVEVICPVCGRSYLTDDDGMVPTHFIKPKPTSVNYEACASSRTPLVEEQGSLF
jgi:uncharacterized Zn finger protein (UPF0148 family)